jgi:hypothetical protein
MKNKIFVFALAFSAAVSLFAAHLQNESPQPSASAGYSVTLGAFIEPKQVPVNRTAILTLRLTWEGALDSVVVGEVFEPILSNLEITGTSTSNKVVGTQTGTQSIKEIRYTLKPKSLGMGYIDSVRVNYEDRKAGVVHQLKTQRLSVEAIDPVPEKQGGSRLWLWAILFICFITGTFGGAMAFLKSRKRKPRETAPIQKPAEETYLDSLKEKVDLQSENRQDAFVTLSKLFRQYLSDKFGIAALEATTKELLGTLRNSGVEENLLRKCEAIFEKADVIKFSGRKASQAELEEAYTTVESVFESKLAEERLQLQRVQEEALRQAREKGNWLKRIFTIRKTEQHRK